MTKEEALTDWGHIVLNSLAEKLYDFCEANGLPFESADELALAENITDEQRTWLIDFGNEWDAACDRIWSPASVRKSA